MGGRSTGFIEVAFSLRFNLAYKDENLVVFVSTDYWFSRSLVISVWEVVLSSEQLTTQPKFDPYREGL